MGRYALTGMMLDLASAMPSSEVLVSALALPMLDGHHADAQRGCQLQQPSWAVATLHYGVCARQLYLCASSTAWVMLAQVRVWDVRMYKPRHAYFSHAPVEALDISQRGLLALGHGRTVQVGVCWDFQCRGLVQECACEFNMLIASLFMRSWTKCRTDMAGVWRVPHCMCHVCDFPLLVFGQAPCFNKLLCRGAAGLGGQNVILRALPACRCGRTRSRRSSSRRTCARRWRAAAFAACAFAPMTRALTLLKGSPSSADWARLSAHCSVGGSSQ